MKICLKKRSYFTFRGKPSYELDLLGKTAYDLMKERLGAEEDDGKGERIVLFPAYPFLTIEELMSYVEGREGSYSFPGGYILRGAPMTASPRMQPLAPGLFTLTDYSNALAYAVRESAKLHMREGALVETGAIVSFTVKLGRGTAVRRGAYVLGNSVVGENAEIGAGSCLKDSTVGEGSTVLSSVLTGASVGKNCEVGPWAYLRPGTAVGDGCRIGDFVELKNAQVGGECKIAHLAYVGDAALGKRVNVGCGAVFVNYDGRTKSRTTVGDGCFIGSNCNLIAPISLGDGAFVAAGTTLTRSLEEEDFCVGRCRETIKTHRGREYYDPFEGER